MVVWHRARCMMRKGYTGQPRLKKKRRKQMQIVDRSAPGSTLAHRLVTLPGLLRLLCAHLVCTRCLCCLEDQTQTTRYKHNKPKITPLYPGLNTWFGPSNWGCWVQTTSQPTRLVAPFSKKKKGKRCYDGICSCPEQYEVLNFTNIYIICGLLASRRSESSIFFFSSCVLLSVRT